jgi:quaternary ammonium compound-resistance protein SugE
MFATLAGLAALCFAIGGYFTKLSHGLTAWRPTAMMFALFLIGSALQAVAMRNESMAVTYVVVLGLEAVTALLLSVLLLQETASAIRFGGIALVVAGIILLKGSAH